MALDVRRNFIVAQFDIFSPNFKYAFILTRSSLGLLLIIFLIFVPELFPLYLCQNFISAQFLENQLIEFHQILYMHSSWQDLTWDCLQICTRAMALDVCRKFVSAQYLENLPTFFHQILYMHSY